jgi:hypothetical protein
LQGKENKRNPSHPDRGYELLPHTARSGSQQRMLARGVEGDKCLPHTARSGSQQRMLARGVEGDERLPDTARSGSQQRMLAQVVEVTNTECEGIPHRM